MMIWLHHNLEPYQLLKAALCFGLKYRSSHVTTSSMHSKAPLKLFSMCACVHHTASVTGCMSFVDTLITRLHTGDCFGRAQL